MSTTLLPGAALTNPNSEAWALFIVDSKDNHPVITAAIPNVHLANGFNAPKLTNEDLTLPIIFTI